MSLWKIGAQDVTEEAQAIKDQLSSKDSHIAAQETKLMRQAAQLEELKSALNETFYKLSQESDRATRLERDLGQATEDLSREKIACLNVEATLSATQEKVKSKERETRELESIIQNLSHTSDSAVSQRSKLEKEKATLEAHVRELEANYRQLSQSPPTTTPTSRLPRRRSSSVSNVRIPALEEELQRAKVTLTQKERELDDTCQKLTRAQDALLKCENERMAMEKRLGGELRDLRAQLDEKDEELNYMRHQLGDGSREAELMARIDEDEAKIAELEKMASGAFEANALRDRLRMAEAKVKDQEKQSGIRHTELVAEKEAALDELEEAQAKTRKLLLHVAEQDARIAVLLDQEATLRRHVQSAALPTDDNTAAHVERLLVAIERLRGERDGLRRDLEYVQVESRYTIEALETKLAASSPPTPPIASATSQQAQDHHIVNRKLVNMSTSLAIVVGRLQDQLEGSLAFSQHLCEELHQKDVRADDLECRLKSSQENLEATNAQLLTPSPEWTASFDEVTTSNLSTRAELTAVQERLSHVLKLLEEVESERDSLALQLTNLTADLATAQGDLEEAETRYSNLQHQQLNAMSDNDATRALREQVHELEYRVLRRTEQVGLHQHDIKRLETNLKLQEERLMEMTSEMETLAAQKEAMVEDCASARDARDEAQQQIELLEIEVERLEAEAETANQSAVNLVAVIVDTVSRSRRAIQELRSHALQVDHQFSECLARKDTEMQHMASLHQNAALELHSNTSNLRGLELSLSDTQSNARALVTALAISRMEGIRSTTLIDRLREARSSLAHQVGFLESQCNASVSEKHTLSQRLDTLGADLEHMTNERAALQDQVRDLESALAEATMIRQATITELTTQNGDLQQRLANAELVNKAVEGSELVSLNERIEELQSCLKDAESALKEAKSCIQSGEAALKDSDGRREAIEQQLRDAHYRYEEVQTSRTALEQEIERQVAKIKDLESKLEVAEIKASQYQAGMQALRDESETQVSQVRKDLEQRLDEERTLCATLQTDLEEQVKQVEESSRKVKALESKLLAENDAHIQEQNSHRQILSEMSSRKQDIETLLANTQQQLNSVEMELTTTNGTVEALQKERESMLTEMTTLEAEVQKSLSLHRYLEGQVKESERTVASLTAALDEVRDDLSQAQKLAQSSEMNLSLQNSHHKREMGELQRQLTALQSQPKLDAVVQELEERIAELDDLLRVKCAEIEENDDRVLEMLKDNKKLNSKVEVLTRKVQSLQTKLAATKMPSVVVPASNSRSSPETNLSSSTQRSRSVTAPTIGFTTTTAPTVSSHPHPTSTRAPPSRHATSGPSTLPRPKTPERPSIAAPVFKARTPERPPMPSASSSTSAGKKRRAPDDFDLCENVPPQVFTVDSVPDEDADNRTPRVRRVLQSLHSGFTPVRHQFASRSNPALASPKRSVTTGSRSPSKSPRLNSTATKSKRSWLGKIRGASQASRPPPEHHLGL